ncbi:DUF1670 domain-containing protein [candidate division CSSED10-310 bacterium]|uniref:DUF1670 domain-containing protein n=1 Tax=candidate division CSSED10-310 bacterium TaxID=2855610 RepID=A0ABV6Z662_UNCC1
MSILKKTVITKENEYPMFAPPQSYKHYNSAKKRLLHGALEQFFGTELPAVFGPLLRKRIVDEIVDIVDKMTPQKDNLRPGQIVWNAVSIDTRPSDPNCKFVPVILTLIDHDDIEDLASGEKMTTIAQNAIARISKEAEQQGAYLSMRDIGLFSWRQNSNISSYRKSWEQKHDAVLPHIGSKQDFGTCLTHKEIIIKKVVLDKKDPRIVAKETNHSQRCVDRYLKDYNRVKTCCLQNKELWFIQNATGLSKGLILQYLRIIEKNEKKT